MRGRIAAEWLIIMALVNLNFESKYLRCNIDVTIILPDKPRGADPEEFYTRGEKYKVLWLLHGTFGDHTDWYRHTNIELYACEKDCIVVMPSAINTNYSNWSGFGTGYYMNDFIIKELMPLVHNWLPASSRREDNFIGGLSMGSRGALKIGLANPDKFGGIAALSAFPHNYEEERDQLEALLTKDVNELIEKSTCFSGPFQQEFRDLRAINDIRNFGGTVDDYIRANNQWQLVEKLAGKPECPKLYCAIGSDDVLYPEYVNFKAHAEKIGLNATFVEEAGYKHEWRFWDKYIEKALEFFGMVGETGGKEFLG